MEQALKKTTEWESRKDQRVKNSEAPVPSSDLALTYDLGQTLARPSRLTEAPVS